MRGSFRRRSSWPCQLGWDHGRADHLEKGSRLSRTHAHWPRSFTTDPSSQILPSHIRSRAPLRRRRRRFSLSVSFLRGSRLGLAVDFAHSAGNHPDGATRRKRGGVAAAHTRVGSAARGGASPRSHRRNPLAPRKRTAVPQDCRRPHDQCPSHASSSLPRMTGPGALPGPPVDAYCPGPSLQRRTPRGCRKGYAGKKTQFAWHLGELPQDRQ